MGYGKEVKLYKTEINFDSPFPCKASTGGVCDCTYVNMTLESGSLKELEWMIEVIKTTPDQDIRSNFIMAWPIEEVEVPDEA